jgi:uncharacterized protein with HEPN domain
MAESRVGDRLGHILDAIEAIEGYCTDKTEAQYRADRMLRDAVERNLERISEASRHVPDVLKASHPEIQWRGIADIGNILRHGYDHVLDGRIWQVVVIDMPAFKIVVQTLLRDIDRDPPEGSR